MRTEDRVSALEERVSTLEAALQQSGSTTPGTQPGAEAAPAQTPDADTFWALEGLRDRVPAPGAVMMVGSVETPAGGEVRWQTGAGADELFSSDFADRADSLSALAHPARLRILQRLMTDAQTVQDLVGTGEFGTSGQIYHHLRQLTSAS